MVDKLIPKGVQQNKSLRAVISLALIVIICIIIFRIYKGVKATSNVVGNAVGNEIIAAQLGMQTARVVYIRGEATRLWTKGITTVLWIRNYDEAMFIVTINGMVTAEEVRLLDQFYQEQSGERLRDAIDKSFSASDKSKLNTNWLSVLNS